MRKYDAILIGSGQASDPLALFLASKGMKIAIIEKDKVGGTCVNYGCTPTKALVATAKIAYQSKIAGSFGVETGEVRINFKKVFQRINEIVSHSRNGNINSFRAHPNIDLIYGEARFLGKKIVGINNDSKESIQISADRIYINTGLRPNIPEINGIGEIPYLTSTNIFSLNTLPEHLIIIGAGYIALEFAQIFLRLGSKVTILNRGSIFLPKEDHEISESLKNILENEGIRLLMEANPTKVEKKEGTLTLEYLQNGKYEAVEGSHLLLAVGRVPNSELNLEMTGIKVDKKGFIEVNEFLETSIQGIYALGDVKGGPAFTHISYDDFRIIRDNFNSTHKRNTGNRLLNYTLFTDPELGRIGINENEAARLGIDYQVVQMPMTHVARAVEMGETKGLMKAILERKSGKILGASILGVGGGELAALVQMAMEGGRKGTDLHNFIFSHPTLAESLNNLFANSTQIKN